MRSDPVVLASESQDYARRLQNLTFAAAIAKRPVSAELTHLALDIFIILLYQYLLQVRQDEHHGLAT